MVRDRLLGEASVGLLDWVRGDGTDDDTGRSDAGRSETTADEDGTASPRRSGGDDAAESREPRADRAAMDGGDGLEWTEDDPIQFGEDGDDGGALLEAVTSESADAAPAGQAPLLAGGLGAETEEPVTDDPATIGRTDSEPESRAGPADRSGSEGSGGESGSSDRSGSDSGSSDGSGGDSARPDGVPDGTATTGSQDATSLHDRVASMEDEQHHVASNVEALESNVSSLHGELESVRSDLETLVTLVKQTAPTRGGVAAAEPPTETSGADDPAPEETATAPDGDPAEAADPAATGGTASEDANESRGPSANAEPEADANAATDTTPEPDAEATTDAAPEPDEPTARAGAGRAEPERSTSPSPIDPRSDAVEERLRRYRERFDRTPTDGDHVSLARLERDLERDPERGLERDSERGSTATGDVGNDAVGDSDVEGGAADGEGGAADGDGSDAHGFEFTKVLLPPDGDGTPAVVGGGLEQPYLEALPEGVAAEATVIEWLDGIVSTADQAGAVQAVEFYESIDWLTADVRDALLGYLKGVGPIESSGAPARPPEELDLADHRRSLEYVTTLASGEVTTDGI